MYKKIRKIQFESKLNTPFWVVPAENTLLAGQAFSSVAQMCLLAKAPC